MNFINTIIKKFKYNFIFSSSTKLYADINNEAKSIFFVKISKSYNPVSNKISSYYIISSDYSILSIYNVPYPVVFYLLKLYNYSVTPDGKIVSNDNANLVLFDSICNLPLNICTNIVDHLRQDYIDNKLRTLKSRKFCNCPEHNSSIVY